MKERGMIFNAEMVRALLDGRKTQTRRIVKGTDGAVKFCKEWDINGEEIFVVLGEKDRTGMNPVLGAISCPFGAVGDRIWVRETFQGPLFDYDLMDSYCKDPTPFEKPEFCVYKADGVPAPEFYDADDELHCCWRPSIHMPRWASRIQLEITGVRVERLQSITLGDICKEVGCGLYDFRPATYGFQVWEELWKSIYGAESWNANPWVWVIEFKRVEAEKSEGGAA
ncbi:TPA: morphogenetic protein [Klebsiella pneumoniae]|uniref:morphogenetic protein n=1 Tax=Klebsiella TaxID=570 RepID=UPI00191AAD1B|nr:morphogenetic protein [Klebsiella pneumoniae]ELA1815448.1 morphogenetic protein [Klebsiella pneumoniae]MCD9841795.1 morphogenetic protein [Klebsiella pneumoniae]MDK6754607.1 morphogenetic protein [Klebsiella pneumoniae]HBR7455505.1 morphogenetic protein [Klebsiella pneumoniae]HBT5020698.1 morphogenetic protein [Klebsiella pneumoniae]